MSGHLDTPEILDLICNHAGIAASSNLLRVNKRFFSVAVPFVWKSIDSPLYLLALIPDLDFDKIGNNPMKCQYEIVLPPHATADFTRFDLYARHVRSFDIHRARYKVMEWATLILRSKVGPLLPGLLKLSIWSMPLFHDGSFAEELMWARVFLAQSVTSVRFCREMGIWAPFAPRQTVLSLLDTIHKTCPNVDNLALPSISQNAEFVSLPLPGMPPRRLENYLSHFSGLRVLKVGIWIFAQDIAHVLGSLTQLNELFLHPEEEPLPLPDVSPFDDNAFPSLRKLSFFCVEWESVCTLLEYPSLTRNITYFRIDCALESDEVSMHNTRALSLIRNMPALQEVKIIFDEMDAPYDLDIDDFEGSLSEIPLQTVRIVAAIFSSFSSIPFQDVFSEVTTLELPNQIIDLLELTWLATMPKLEYLNIAFSDGEEETNWLVENHSSCPTFRTLEISIDFAEDENEESVEIYPVNLTHTAAAYLLKLFPNIERIIWPFVDERTYEYQRIHVLNTRIVTIRRWNQVRARIAERYGSEIADSVIKDDDLSHTFDALS
ncbi:hypothetical protein RhiJN_18509 [Ceratobasidium sp. AG-Ba]|nr:hypothetical protein RhiJN_18509 [Ceratobasidium sp. AG-Ba]